MLNANAIQKAIKGVFQLVTKINSWTVCVCVCVSDEKHQIILEYNLFVCKRIWNRSWNWIVTSDNHKTQENTL
jgi:hypothetical protein